MAEIHDENQATENPAENVQAKEETPGVGVLGWLGFVIINLAIWGIISVSTALSWIFGFVVLFIYFVILISMAFCMQKLGSRFASFQNILWVLACWAIFVIGLYLAINVVGDLADETENGLIDHTFNNAVDPPRTRSISELLPENSSAALTDYAGSEDFNKNSIPTYAAFQGFVFLNGMSSEFMNFFKWGKGIALRSDGTATVKLEPILRNARNFIQYDSKLFFLAENDTTTKSGIWSVDSAAAVNAAPSAQFVGLQEDTLRQLAVVDGKLWVKAHYSCGTESTWLYVDSLFSFDGTALANIRGERCGGVADPTDPEPWNPSRERPIAEMWATVFIGVVPMIVVAALVLWKFKMEGMFFNIYAGFGILVGIIYNIATDQNVDVFFKWFFTSYAAISYIVFGGYCLLNDKSSPLMEKMKDWIVVLVGLLFFLMIHIALKIPATDSAGNWVLYAILAPVQMILSIVMLRSLPFVLGALSTFVVAWKIAREISVTIFDNGDYFSQEETLAMLAIVALQGIAIIAGAVLYAANRDKVDNTVRSALRRCLQLRRNGGGTPDE